MKLYFLRHGESETNAAGLLGGHLDKPLTQKGIQQAESAVEKVRAIAPNVIYCSPLLRAHKTAEIVAEPLGMKDDLRVDPRVMERFAGSLEGKPDEGKIKVSTIPDDTEGVERIADFESRVGEFLDELKANHPDETVLLVCHGGTIKMCISILTGRPWEEIRDIFTPNSVPFQSIEEVME